MAEADWRSLSLKSADNIKGADLDKNHTLKKYILLDIVFCEYKYLYPFAYNFLTKDDIYIKLDIVK